MFKVFELLKMASKFESLAVELKERTDKTKQWTISYFDTEKDALRSDFAEKGSEAKKFEKGWLLYNPNNNLNITDAMGSEYTEDEIYLIESRIALPLTIKRLKRIQRIKEFENVIAMSVFAKLDPKAKVRNRGDVCFSAERTKDHKDHFPINNIDQARNALARANQYTKVPEWYKGTLKSLVNTVARKVHSKYPSIDISEDAKKPGAKK